MEDPMRRTRVSEMPAYALRHGSPDKIPAAPIDVFEVTCPACDATLCVERALLSVAPEFDCACCGREIALTRTGALRADRWFPRAVARS
jgi:transposase-like protein